MRLRDSFGKSNPGLLFMTRSLAITFISQRTGPQKRWREVWLEGQISGDISWMLGFVNWLKENCTNLVPRTLTIVVVPEAVGMLASQSTCGALHLYKRCVSGGRSG